MGYRDSSAKDRESMGVMWRSRLRGSLCLHVAFPAAHLSAGAHSEGGCSCGYGGVVLSPDHGGGSYQTNNSPDGPFRLQRGDNLCDSTVYHQRGALTISICHMVLSRSQSFAGESPA